MIAVLDPISFKVGDGLPGTPAANSNTYTNANLIGLTTKQFAVNKAGYGFLIPGLYFSFNSSAGTITLTGTDVFSDEGGGDEYWIFFWPLVTNSGSTYGNGDFLDCDVPYLPDILEGVVARVNAVFSTGYNDPFNVYFDYGLERDVSNNIYKKATAEVNPGTFPLVWLVMNYSEVRGRRIDKYADVSCNIIIAMPTVTDYTMQERTANSFKPRLIPIYQEVLNQISFDLNLSTPELEKIEHSKIDLPYWGGGDTTATNTKNLFKNFIDAILIKDLKLSLEKCTAHCTILSNF